MINYLSLEDLHLLKEKYSQFFLDKNLHLDSSDLNSLSEKLIQNILLIQNVDSKLAINILFKYNLKALLQSSIQPLHEKIENSLKVHTNQYFQTHFDFLPLSDASFHLNYSDSHPRHEIIDSAFSSLNINYKTARNQKAYLAIEELLMNSQITANTLQSENSIQSVENILEMQVRQNLLSISVTDFKGTLDPLTFLYKIFNTLNIGVKDAINYSTRGAGIGSSFIYNSCETIYIGVMPKQITKIAVIIPLNTNSITNDSLQKSIILYNPKG